MSVFIPVDDTHGITFNEHPTDKDGIDISIILLKDAKKLNLSTGIICLPNLPEDADVPKANLEHLLSKVVLDPIYLAFDTKEKENFLSEVDRLFGMYYGKMKDYLDSVGSTDYQKAIIKLTDNYYVDFQYDSIECRITAEVKDGLAEIDPKEVSKRIDNLPPFEEDFVNSITNSIRKLSGVPDEHKDEVISLCKRLVPLAFAVARAKRDTYIVVSENVVLIIHYDLLSPKEVTYGIGLNNGEHMPEFKEDPNSVYLGILENRFNQNYLDKYIGTVMNNVDYSKLAEAGIDGDEIRLVKDRLENYIPAVLKRTLKQEEN